jgi:hypothetical protein
MAKFKNENEIRVEGVLYVSKVSIGDFPCKGCYFQYDIRDCKDIPCCQIERKDKRGVIFKLKE